jgi:hypothetical protein
VAERGGTLPGSPAGITNILANIFDFDKWINTSFMNVKNRIFPQQFLQKIVLPDFQEADRESIGLDAPIPFIRE